MPGETEKTKQLRDSPNLYLIGFMGVGKSAVGRVVARRLGLDFYDSDWCIERSQDKSISEIFSSDGEVAFREMEREFVLSGHPPKGCLISCGGGLPVQPGMRELLLTRGIVVCLFARPETVIERTRHNDKRPLLNVKDAEERIRSLMAEREEIYKSTGIGVSTEGRRLNEIADNVIRIYQRESPLFLKKVK